MSLRKGDNKKQAQKWKNTSAFKIVFDTKAVENHQKVTLDKLCPRCVEVIRWKMTYNKYKKATTESRCVKCLEKNIFKSYRHACDPCAKLHKICAKCLQPTEQLSSNPNEEKEKEDRIEQEMEEYLTKLRERTRRTLNRKIQKELVRWDEEKKHFVEVESGLRLDNLKFKAGLEDEDNVDEADECEEFEAGDFDKKEKEDSDPKEGNEKEKEENTNNEDKTEKQQPIPEKKPAKTQKEMLALAKQIDFGSDSEDDDDDEDDENDI